jgi:colanic acid biosynthesis glycosyl transferase WcaI
MKFLIIGLNYSPEPTGNAVYTSELSQSLAALGHHVQVICAAPHYPQWQTYRGFRGFRWSRDFEQGVNVWRCPIYVPAMVTGLKRVLYYASFGISSMIPVFWSAMRKRPDVVINVAPTLISAPAGLLAAHLTGAKSLLHLQDFEVEAGFATGQMGAEGCIARLAISFSNAVIRAHDLATSISPAMVRKLDSSRAPILGAYEFRNWANIDQIRPSNNSTYRAKWAITTPHVVMYSGSIARKQGLEILVHAARLMTQRRDVTFVICGNGPYREQLEKSARGLNNILFKDLQPKENLSDLLSLATVHLLPQMREAADLVLPSKLTNMLASGRPIVAGAAQGTALADEIEGCGIAVPPEDASAMVAAIDDLINDQGRRDQLGSTARVRAETVWSREPIIHRFVNWLEQAIEK